MRFLDDSNIPYCVAVVESFLDESEYCSVEELSSLKKAQFIFHTVHHKSLIDLSDEEVEMELNSNSIREKLPISSNILVYPRGLYDARIISIAEKAGVQYGLTCLPFHWSNRANPLTIPRINVSGNLQMWKFKLFVSVWGNIYLHLAFLKRKLLGENYLDE
jgi:peptidoglycan/xylan/chitin deacetylase (PgdA/CDA1 family)